MAACSRLRVNRVTFPDGDWIASFAGLSDGLIPLPLLLPASVAAADEEVVENAEPAAETLAIDIADVGLVPAKGAAGDAALSDV